MMLEQGHIEDEDDKWIESLTSVLILTLGILSVSISIILMVNTATMLIYTTQAPTDLLTRSIITTVLLAMGFAAMYLFRNRRQTQKQKQSGWFSRKKG